MKKAISLLLALAVLFSFAGCGSAKPDYEDEAVFEAALNNGEDLSGKTVKITVKKFVPDSAFGYNLQCGEHLNFCSPDNPDVSEGETLVVKVVEVASMLGSYIISYEKA